MFHKLKQFKDLRSQAKQMQSTLSEEQVEVDMKGITLKMDGNQKVLSFKISEELSVKDVERVMPDVIDSAIKKVQKVMAAKMQSMGGMKQFGL